MRRFAAGGFLASAILMACGKAFAASQRTEIPDFVQTTLNAFKACVQKQSVRVVPTNPPPDTRMELCGANFMWPKRDDLAFVRKCLTRGKVIYVEHMPSFRVKGGEGFNLMYDCTTPYLYLSVSVEVHENSARVFDVGQAMP